MEKLTQYVWKHKLFPLRELYTTDGDRVEVIDTGLHNRNAGPDFCNATARLVARLPAPTNTTFIASHNPS